MKNTFIEWTDHINPNATGRLLGSYKSAAKKTGCSLEQWMSSRRAGNKWCFRCKTWRSVSMFSLDRSRRGGLTSSCKPCASDASTASRYGISIAKLLEFRESHLNKCGICSDSLILYVDHNHKTGKLRGLLCPSCNSAIGLLGENPSLFAAAVSYLEQHNG
jgi:hypothetical protein